jgi:pyruvate dehydrogenase E2 component (dihydrolipoamide acetyltransferase)
MEFESFNEGELLHIGIQEGGTAPVDTLLAIIGKKGEDISALLKEGGELSQKAPVDESTSGVSISKEVALMPEDAELITMPRLSDTMEEGTVASWLKKVGDTVNEGDILAEIETDKATMEFESFYQGTLLYVGLNEGETAAVDSVLAIIGKKGTDVDLVLAAHGSKEIATPAPIKESITPTEIVSVEETKSIKAEISHPVSSVSERIVASPLAKKMANEKGLNLNQIKGSGENGRIIKRDIDNYQPQQYGMVQPFTPSGTESVTVIANSQMRKTIAKRLSNSKFTAPHYYLGVEFDMDNAISFRSQYNSLPETKISFNDIVMKAAALALKIHPQVNAKWEDSQITQHHHVHVGVAVARTFVTWKGFKYMNLNQSID